MYSTLMFLVLSLLTNPATNTPEEWLLLLRGIQQSILAALVLGFILNLRELYARDLQGR